MNSQTARRADTMSGRESTIVAELKSKGREIVSPGKQAFWGPGDRAYSNRARTLAGSAGATPASAKLSRACAGSETPTRLAVMPDAEREN